jgi:XTP/dITP diphosphohydrolase
MSEPLSVTTLLIATRNSHKADEMRSLLGERYLCLTLNDLPAAPRTIEDADTFAGNAAKKALELAAWCGPRISNHEIQISSPAFVLADDSGLEVAALDGAPGVHSARFAALTTGKSGNAPDAENNARLLHLLKDVPEEKRAARFRCVLALVRIGTTESGTPVAELFDGTCEGRIGFMPRGREGFGYDPLFLPDGFDKTFAELGEETKNTLSHRARALGQLRAWLDSRAAGTGAEGRISNSRHQT